jgi:XTP/dITP diphosphohydrolase
MTRPFSGDRLLVATHNKGKLEEIADLLKPYGVSVVGAAEMNLPEPEETETTFVGNARIKAHAAAKATGLPALSDDSGIEIDALDGAPGVYTADWAETPNGRDFVMAMERAHRELEAKNAPHPRTARFCCTLVLAWPDGHDEVFPGVMPGQVVWPMRGDQGHGYDPIFQPDGYDITFGEMDRWEKNRISHRADAFRKLVEGCFGG